MNRETLLIVDDNQVLREGLGEMLGSEGFQVITAANGLEALQCMEQTTPDLIMSDVAMPGMDGYTFFNHVRVQPEWVTIPFLFLTARAEREDVLAGKNLGAEDYLTKPLSRDELLTAIRSRLARARQLRVVQLQQAYEASLTALANAIDLRDQYTRCHVERVTAYSLALAQRLGWQEWRLTHLRFGAILHDIGKIHIRESTLFKSTELDESEWEEVKRHPVIGADMIRDINFLAPAAPVVLHHHERWDGGGYPHGLAGEAIPEGARIVALADALDAMTTERPYSPARTLDEAYAEILRGSGKQFDPGVVAAFQEIWCDGEFQAISTKW
jgi:putative two-component system response regulator